MRIRVLSPYFPFPPDEGNFLTVFDQICTLSQGHEVEVVSWLNSSEDFARRRQGGASVQIPSQVRCTLLPDAAGDVSRIGKVQRLLVGLLGRRPSPETLYYPSAICTRIAALEPVDLEIFHHTVAYPALVGAGRPGQRRVCMVHDFNSLLYQQKAAAARGWARWFYGLNARWLRSHEQDLRNRVDELWFVTPVELEEFSRFPGTATLRLVPPTFNLDTARQRRDGFDPGRAGSAPAVFGLIGDLRHVPNLKSLEFVLDEVCPQLVQRGFNGVVRVAGKGCPPSVAARAADYPFVRIEGFVPDLAEYYRSLSLMLVPHVSGTGVRMKLLEALAAGVPVLAHQEAVRRLHPDLRSGALLISSDHAEEWAAILSAERAGQRRAAGAALPVPDALTGAWVYRFLQTGAIAAPGRAR